MNGCGVLSSFMYSPLATMFWLVSQLEYLVAKAPRLFNASLLSVVPRSLRVTAQHNKYVRRILTIAPIPLLPSLVLTAARSCPTPYIAPV